MADDDFTINDEVIKTLPPINDDDIQETKETTQADNPPPPIHVLSDVERLQLEIDAVKNQLSMLNQALTAMRGLTLAAIGLAGFAYFKATRNHSEPSLNNAEKEAPIAAISPE